MVGMQLIEKYKENFRVSDEAPKILRLELLAR
jgi:hypothetical protein